MGPLGSRTTHIGRHAGEITTLATVLTGTNPNPRMLAETLRVEDHDVDGYPNTN
jgi:hypothetical protein